MPKQTHYRDRIERQGRVSSEWKVSDDSQQVKVYRPTAEGKKHPASERSRRGPLSEAITRALNPLGQEGEA